MYHLDAMRLEFDEAFSVQAGFRDLSSLMRLLATNEPHPPLFYSLIHFWHPIFGDTEFALRFPSVIASVLTVAFVIRLAHLLGWDDAGLVAAVLLVINPYQVWYAQEIRMYAPVACFGVGAACFALQARRSGRRRDLVGYAIFMLLALFTHYFAIFLATFFGALVGLDLLLNQCPEADPPSLFVGGSRLRRSSRHSFSPGWSTPRRSASITSGPNRTRPHSSEW